MSSTDASSESMIASYGISSYNSSKNMDFEFASPVFYLPPVMPLTSDSVYAPFETDENGAIQFPVREYAADYSYDNHDWQSQVDSFTLSTAYSNDDTPMSPTDSLTTSSSSEEDQDMMYVDSSAQTASSSPPHTCFSSIAGFALKGYF